MKIDTEMYWVLRNKDCDTYAHYLDCDNGGMTDAWDDVKTAEHFDSREEAEECAKDEGMEHLEAVHVIERVMVCESVDEFTQTEVERIKAVFNRYFEWDVETELPHENYDPTYRAEDAIDDIVRIVYGHI